MRIAVSGTHCSGKTTLVEEFLRVHPDFVHEPEAYSVLVEEYGEEFASEPTADEFYRQLEFQVERLRSHDAGERVIYERSPVDYLGYLLALADLKRDHTLVRTTCVSGRPKRIIDWPKRILETALPLVVEGVRNLDLIVFLPLDESHPIELPDDEDPKLRRAMDKRLATIFEADEFDLVNDGRPVIGEARGSTAQRLRMLEDAMAATRNGQ